MIRDSGAAIGYAPHPGGRRLAPLLLLGPVTAPLSYQNFGALTGAPVPSADAEGGVLGWLDQALLAPVPRVVVLLEGDGSTLKLTPDLQPPLTTPLPPNSAPPAKSNAPDLGE